MRARRTAAWIWALPLALLVPAIAIAAWTQPVALSKTGASAPQVAVDSGGDAVFAWLRFDGANDRVQARSRSADGTLSVVRTLSPAGGNASEPVVAVDADGDAVFTWSRNGRIEARARSAAGVLSPVQRLSRGQTGSREPSVAMDADGDAVFTWLQRVAGEAFAVNARARSAIGSLSAVQSLSTLAADDPDVAVDADGDAVFAWYRRVGAHDRIETRAWPAGGGLSAVQTVAGGFAHGPQVAVDPGGDAVFAWLRVAGSNDRVTVRARSAAGALSPGRMLSPLDGDAYGQQLAVDAAGDAVLAWERADGGYERIQARALSTAGALSTVRTLSRPEHNALDPALAVDADGNAVVTWLLSDGGHNRLQARTRSAGGALGVSQTLSDRDHDAFAPAIASDPDGDAVLAWGIQGGAVQAAAGP